MEIIDPENQNQIYETPIDFYGDGKELFGIMLVNYILTIVTLGLYYPWARAAYFKYIYSKVEFYNSPLTFHGTGKEMFKGFIKAFLLLAALLGLYLYGFDALKKHEATALPYMFGAYVGFFLLIPLMVHGGLRYRMSRTSWRGIHFGYRGDLGELYKIWIVGGLLTLVTIGIYSSWMMTNFRKYIFNHLRLGSAEIKWEGTGSRFWWLNYRGIVLTMATLGIYLFGWILDIFRFYYNGISIKQGDKEFQLRIGLSSFDVFKLVAGNFLITLFTLGLGAPWVITRQFTCIINSLELENGFNPDIVAQTEDDFGDATGDDFTDMMDMGIV
jgi:uncharacterized membrane protein YjgN (DUF898 family)